MSESPPYDPRAFPPVAVTVDVVALTIRDGELHVLLVRRGGRTGGSPTLNSE